MKQALFQNKVLLILSLIFLIVSGWLATLFIQSTINYKASKESYAQALYFKNRILNPQEWVPSEGANPVIAKAAQFQAKIANEQLVVKQQLWLLLIPLLLFAIYLAWNYWRTKEKAQLAYGAIILAMVCLYIGLFSPVLEIAAFERNLDLGKIPIRTNVYGFDVNFNFEKQFEGDLYFYYQSKSVMELIQLLFQQRNWVVGISILSFSILFPLSKIIVSLLALFRPMLTQNHLSRLILFKSGKWSMADVFVAAMFLAYLAFANMQIGIQTDSNALPGLYFFLAFCVLSIGSSALMDSSKKDILY